MVPTESFVFGVNVLVPLVLLTRSDTACSGDTLCRILGPSVVFEMLVFVSDLSS